MRRSLAGWMIVLACASGAVLQTGLVFAQLPKPEAVQAAVGASAGRAASAAVSVANTSDNPYGVRAVWEQGDWVAKFTLLTLIAMSMASWYVIFTKWFEQSRLRRQTVAMEQQFWKAGSLRLNSELLAPDSPFRFIAEHALQAAGRREGLLGTMDPGTGVTLNIQKAMTSVQSRLHYGLGLLATVGSTAPFVGLFGTVWGIYNALVKIGVSGQASIGKVAGPVGEALIMTAIGLAVAVPAVLGYNFLVRRNKSAMEGVQAFGNDLHAVLLATHIQPETERRPMELA